MTRGKQIFSHLELILNTIVTSTQLLQNTEADTHYQLEEN